MSFADYISKWGETHALDMTCCNFLVLCWDFSLSLYPFTKKKKKERKEQLLLVIIAMSVLRLLYYFIYPDNSTCGLSIISLVLWLRILRHKNASNLLKSSASR